MPSVDACFRGLANLCSDHRDSSLANPPPASSTVMKHLLDNIVWRTLTGHHVKFASGAGQARRYARGFSPIVGFADPEHPDLDSLAPHCRADEHFYSDGWSGAAPSTWTIERVARCAVIRSERDTRSKGKGGRGARSASSKVVVEEEGARRSAASGADLPRACSSCRPRTYRNFGICAYLSRLLALELVQGR